MSNPPDPTNLTQKFEALRQQMTTQHDALMLAITALRGSGPENTLKSINQSIWNLVGPAPGATLVELKAAISELGGGKNLANLFSQWDGGTGITAYNLLSNIYTALTNSGLSQDASKAILVRLIAQFDTAVVTPTMKDLLINIDANAATIADKSAAIADNTTNPLSVVPVGICETPLVSVGSAYSIVSANIVEPYTVATWPQHPGGDFTTYFGVLSQDYTEISCPDWSQYRVYVASKADVFALAWVSPHRYPCNQWVTLPSNAGNVDFTVMGQESLKVYICGAGGSPPTNPNNRQNADPGGCGTGGTYAARITAYSITGTFTDNGVYYNIYHPVIPAVPGLLVQSGLKGAARCDPAWFAAHPRGWVSVCCSWDFTGNVMWPMMGRLTSDDAATVDDNWLGFKSITAQLQGDEMTPSTTTIPRTAREYISYSFAAPAAYGMPQNVFIHVTGYHGV
jgi:hypothetical protein